MTDMTNEEAAEILSEVKIRALANPDDVGPVISALARAIVTLQRPVVTREQLIKLMHNAPESGDPLWPDGQNWWVDWGEEALADAILKLLEGRG